MLQDKSSNPWFFQITQYYHQRASSAALSDFAMLDPPRH
jgi:hypothetical protein